MDDEKDLRALLAGILRRVANYTAQKRQRCALVQESLKQNKKLTDAEAIHLRNCSACRLSQGQNLED